MLLLQIHNWYASLPLCNHEFTTKQIVGVFEREPTLIKADVSSVAKFLSPEEVRIRSSPFYDKSYCAGASSKTGRNSSNERKKNGYRQCVGTKQIAFLQFSHIFNRNLPLTPRHQLERAVNPKRKGSWHVFALKQSLAPPNLYLLRLSPQELHEGIF